MSRPTQASTAAQRAAALKQAPFLAQLSEASRERVMAAATELRVHRGEEIFHTGDPARQCYLILTGKVKLSRTSKHQPPPPPPRPGEKLTVAARRRATTVQTRESLLWVMGPGDMFGELSVFDQGTRSSTAKAVTAATLLRFEGNQLAALVGMRQDVALAMLQVVATRLRRSDDHTTGMVLSDVSGRVAWLLMHLLERFGEDSDPVNEDSQWVRHDLTQTELAQIVGASRETVNKVLTDYESRGIIEVRPREFRVLMPQKLLARVE
ncbi:Crp/Fnr family transcriptional regulator [Propionibacteriaceae bacterium G1746]|uniref:Crp/Fnr family transcriptional regulator n=1 Tax=Aestuariimicrobium sp. G57 TaxID=3418485 RepID=UPI003C1DCE55